MTDQDFFTPRGRNGRAIAAAIPGGSDMNLPSREEFRRMELGEGHGYAQARDAVVDAFQSGRLVDREAIDYATATKVLASLVGPDAHPRRDEVVRAVIAAAIGDTE